MLLYWYLIFFSIQIYSVEKAIVLKMLYLVLVSSLFELIPCFYMTVRQTTSPWNRTRHFLGRSGGGFLSILSIAFLWLLFIYCISVHSSILRTDHAQVLFILRNPTMKCSRNAHILRRETCSVQSPISCAQQGGIL